MALRAAEDVARLGAQIAARVTAQTTAETRPQVGPREALQQTLQVPSAEVLPIAQRLNSQVAVAFYPQTTSRDAAEFAVRFAPEVGSGVTLRTTPGTVPGTVPPVVPGRSTLTGSTASKAALFGYLGGFRLSWPSRPARRDHSAGIRLRSRLAPRGRASRPVFRAAASAYRVTLTLRTAWCWCPRAACLVRYCSSTTISAAVEVAGSRPEAGSPFRNPLRRLERPRAGAVASSRDRTMEGHFYEEPPVKLGFLWPSGLGSVLSGLMLVSSFYSSCC